MGSLQILCLFISIKSLKQKQIPNQKSLLFLNSKWEPRGLPSQGKFQKKR